jgi:hypothetical protein
MLDVERYSEVVDDKHRVKCCAAEREYAKHEDEPEHCGFTVLFGLGQKDVDEDERAVPILEVGQQKTGNQQEERGK